MPYPFVGDLDLANVHIAPLVQKEGKKHVEVFLDSSSTLSSNHIKFQLCPDEREPIETRYALDQPHMDNGDGTRRGLTLIIRNKKAIVALKALEDTIVKHAVAKSKEFFKKELEERTVRDRFKSILTPHPDDSEAFYMKIKVKCTGAKVPTKIKRKISETQVKSSNEHDLSAPGALVVPLVSAYSLYFMAGDAQFGLSFQAEELMVTPGAARDEMSNFALTTTMQVVKDEGDGPTGDATEDAGEGEPAPKKFKVTLEDGEVEGSAM